MANRYFINGGADNNWGTTSNWSLTSNGAGGQAVPLVTDDVFFDSFSPNCTINSVARVALSVNFTGYTNTINFVQALTVSGSVTLSSTMITSGSGALGINGTGSITSNGKTWTNALIFTGNATITLLDNWSVSGALTLGNTGTTTINGFQITSTGNVTITSGTAGVQGNTLLLLAGTGTITGSNSASAALKLSTTINTSGSYTFPATLFSYNTGTLTYIAGTVSIASGSTLYIGGSASLATSGLIWDKVTLGPVSSTVTLSENLNVNGLLKIGDTTAILTLTGSTINAYGGIQINTTSGVISGTTVLRICGSTSNAITSPTGSTNRLGCPVTVDAGAGTVTFSNVINLDLGKFTYTSGAVTTANTWPTGSGGEVSRTCIG